MRIAVDGFVSSDMPPKESSEETKRGWPFLRLLYDLTSKKVITCENPPTIFHARPPLIRLARGYDLLPQHYSGSVILLQHAEALIFTRLEVPTSSNTVWPSFLGLHRQCHHVPRSSSAHFAHLSKINQMNLPPRKMRQNAKEPHHIITRSTART